MTPVGYFRVRPEARPSFWPFALISFLTLCFFASAAEAGQDIPQLVHETGEALNAGKLSEVITTLEGAADSGVHHPDLSFNRALAYQRRSGAANGKVGDLGQAAAGFAETLAQRPSDVEAARGLEEVQLAVARRNSKGKRGSEAQVSSPLGLFERALLSLSPSILFWLSAGGSLVLSIGILLLWSSRDARRLAGRITIGVGALVLIPCSFLFFTRSWVFSDAKMAVVVTQKASVVGEAGARKAGRPDLAESTVVYVKPAKRGLVQLVGVVSGDYLSVAELRLVSQKSL